LRAFSVKKGCYPGQEIVARTHFLGKAKRALQLLQTDGVIDAVESFLTAGNIESLLGDGFDLVIDACDSFRVKIEIIAWCRRRKLPLLTVGAAGGRT
ncbi:ThiF family adenylyltransferase, partial [Xanthomonas fragariae]|uniref:CAF17-like 4Fe-4S cluster assembly/insertion protein YgfZ n=1 Tax=Xanthomonas fragariae TaxID=48664 RepID=UPI0035310D36